MTRYTYHVEMYRPLPLGWRIVSLTRTRSRDYCEGYVDAYDGLYPSQPMKIVRNDGKLVRETKGRGAVHTN